MRIKSVACFSLFMVGAVSLPVAAQIPPSKLNAKLPDAYYQRIKTDSKAFSFEQSFIGLAQRVQENRFRVLNSTSSGFALAVANLQGGIIVAGTKTIPVATALYPELPTPPYDKSVLQKEFFDGPWPTGTLTEFYSAMSYGNLTVKGVTLDWQLLPQTGQFYAGDDYQDSNGTMQHCLGICPGTRVGELIRDVLDRNPTVDWGQFDNDGPDSRPNSGDDDGYVDFIVIVHPGIGGECDVPNNTAIWSHRGQLVKEGGAYTTGSPSTKAGAKNIKINDYVIVPALACDGVSPNPIGIVAHEFGHAFGLPDLYDIDYGTIGGVGDWDLMATGAWGGDDISPQLPTQMSAWSKAFLGWVSPIPVQSDIADIALDPMEIKPMAYEIKGTGTKYFLLSNRQQIGADLKLPTGGLLLETVDTSILQIGLATNRVNVNPAALGVEVVEADGIGGLKAQLSPPGNADSQDAGDLFPGSSNKTNLSSTTNPRSPGSFAICDIRQEGRTIHARLMVSSASCDSSIAVNAAPAPPSKQKHPNADNSPTPSSIDAITKAPDGFAQKVISLSGVIQNTGINYFNNLRLVLTDQTGRSIPVQVPLPIELPPAQLGKQTKSGPKTISTFLGSDVTVTGKVVSSEVQGFGKIYVFQVIDIKPTK
jgi:M6 family metalloprotease-like protein